MKIDKNTQDIIQEIAKELPTQDALLRTVSEQHQIIEGKSTVINEQKKRIHILEEQLRLLRAQRFGKTSEKSDRQEELFNEAELLALNADDEPEQIVLPDVEAAPKKKKKGRCGLSPDLPRQQVLLTLSDEEKDGAIEVSVQIKPSCVSRARVI